MVQTVRTLVTWLLKLNVYESLYNHAITGSLVIADTTNLISNLPIQGTERLSFRLATKLDSYSHEDSRLYRRNRQSNACL